MDNTTHTSRLRYLDADDVDDSLIDYDGLDVKGPDGDTIGNVDGFIVDADASRVYYVVVDSGGWFSSRNFLLPVGHVRLDTEDRALRADLAKDSVRRYPEFDRDTFQKLSDEDLRAYESRMNTACCPDEVAGTAMDSRRHYAQPEWWPQSSSRPTTRTIEADTVTRAAVPVSDRYNDELVTARERVRDREVGDDSPHLDGRAQPGDILGIETGGERTHVGETAEDEDKRRRDALKSARRDDRD